MATAIWAFLIYWLAVFVGCYIVVEIAQDQLYDEITPFVGLKVSAGSFLLALLLSYLQPAFDSMFTTSFAWTVLQAIVWFAVFTLIFQFHPWHGMGLGLASMLLISGLATMGVNSILTPLPASVSRPGSATASKPIRQSLAPRQVVAPAAKSKN